MGRFSNSVPELSKVFPNTEKFLAILDDLDSYKLQKIWEGNRAYNSLLSTNTRKFVEGKLADTGIPIPPSDFPIPLLLQLYMNSGLIVLYRGSKKGVILFLESATMGEVDVDLSEFSIQFSHFAPSNRFRNGGFLPISSQSDVTSLYNAEISKLDNVFDATIKTFYHDNVAVKNYVENNLALFLPFPEDSFSPNITWECGGLVSPLDSYDQTKIDPLINPITSCLPKDIVSRASIFLSEDVSSGAPLTDWPVDSVGGFEASFDSAHTGTIDVIDLDGTHKLIPVYSSGPVANPLGFVFDNTEILNTDHTVAFFMRHAYGSYSFDPYSLIKYSGGSVGATDFGFVLKQLSGSIFGISSVYSSSLDPANNPTCQDLLYPDTINIVLIRWDKSESKFFVNVNQLSDFTIPLPSKSFVATTPAPDSRVDFCAPFSTFAGFPDLNLGSEVYFFPSFFTDLQCGQFFYAMKKKLDLL